MTPETLKERTQALAENAEILAQEATLLARESMNMDATSSAVASGDPFIGALTVFALAVIIGYYVVWGVTPALHSPLMAVTNAISSVIIVGALLAVGTGFAPSQTTPDSAGGNIAPIVGFCAIILASINIFGGFVVSHRMLSMFRKNPRRRETPE